MSSAIAEASNDLSAERESHRQNYLAVIRREAEGKSEPGDGELLRAALAALNRKPVDAVNDVAALRRMAEAKASMVDVDELAKRGSKLQENIGRAFMEYEKKTEADRDELGRILYVEMPGARLSNDRALKDIEKLRQGFPYLFPDADWKEILRPGEIVVS